MSFLSALFGVESEPSKHLGGRNMNNTITLPQTLIKRLEKVSAGRRTPDAIVRQAVQNQLEYEEWFVKQVEAGMADEKAGRVYGKEEFWARLDKARHERKKAA